MSWVDTLITQAGPHLVWFAIGATLMLGFGLWLFITDRMITVGRHYEVVGAHKANHEAQLEQLRTHYQKLLAITEERAQDYKDDRNYWRGTSVDSLSVALEATTKEGGANE